MVTITLEQNTTQVFLDGAGGWVVGGCAVGGGQTSFNSLTRVYMKMNDKTIPKGKPKI